MRRAALLAAIVLARPIDAGFASTDVVVPAVARASGAAGSEFRSTLWITNAGPLPAVLQLQLLRQGQPNPTPLTRTDTVAVGATKRYDNVVETLFGLTGAAGAIRISSSQPVLVSSRTVDLAPGKPPQDAKGLFLGGIPTALAMSPGEATVLQGVSNGAAESYRYNFGLVETTGLPVTALVTAHDGAGATLSTRSITLGAYEARQINAFEGFDPPVVTSNGRLDIAVTGGFGRLIAYGIQIAGTSQSPGSNDSIGFEMAFKNIVGSPGTACAGGPGLGAEPPVRLELGDGFTVRKNLTFGNRGGRVLQGDLYLPPTGGTRLPGILVLIHGGGWYDCARRREAVAWYAEAASRSLRVGVFNIEYRLTQEGGGYPEAASDAKCAVQWAAANGSTYGLDGARIAVAGESAGAHLAALLGVTGDRTDLDPGCAARPTKVSLVVAYSGVYDLPRFAASSSVANDAPNFFAGPCRTAVGACVRDTACDRCIDASPSAHACAAGATRFLLVQAPDGYDPLVPLVQAEVMRQALAGAGANVSLLVPTAAQLQAAGCVPNGVHALANSCLATTTASAVTAALVEAIGP